NNLRAEINARLLSPCSACRGEIVNAIARANLAQTEAAWEAAAPTVREPALQVQKLIERRRAELIETRQRAAQLAQLATTLGTNESTIVSIMQSMGASESLVNARYARPVEFQGKIHDIESVLSSVREQLMRSIH